MSRKNAHKKAKASGSFKLKKLKVIIKGLEGSFDVEAFKNAFSEGLASRDNRNNRQKP